MHQPLPLWLRVQQSLLSLSLALGASSVVMFVVKTDALFACAGARLATMLAVGSCIACLWQRRAKKRPRGDFSEAAFMDRVLELYAPKATVVGFLRDMALAPN